MARPKTKVDPEVAGHAQGAYNIPEKQICPKHNTYKAGGICKICDRENDPAYKAGANDPGMSAEEAAYVRRFRGTGKDPDEVLRQFRERKEG